MGSAARAAIAETGWQGAPISTLIGASGGPKWLILSELDQVLATELLTRAPRPVTLLGSSIGTWRHACLSQPDPVAAIKRLQHAYLHQQYSNPKPVSYTHLRAHETREDLVCRLLLEKKN